jgi:uncharacterized membrane protein YfcA
LSLDVVYFAPLIFFCIAFGFSMLGMGGAQLYVPVLFWLGMDFKTEAIPLGLLLNVAASSSATITYLRNHLVRWRVGLIIGAAMVALAPVGALVNATLSAKALILLFALFTIGAAVLMLSGWRPKIAQSSQRRFTVWGISAGSGIGFLAGLLGRGGGSFVVPTLYMMGLEAKSAVATSLLAVTMSATSGFISHLAMAAHPDWVLWGAGIAAVLGGSQIGSRLMATRVKSPTIRKAFGIVLLCIAGTLVVRDVILG